MKITDVETIVIQNIQPYRGGRYWLFVQLITDEGIVGLGERPSGNATNLDAQISLIKNLCQQFAIGTSPFDIESLWQRIFASRHDYRHPGLDATPALSAIEMACWDIVGKALNQPIYNLLGGRVHDKLRAYAYMPTDGIWENPERAGEIATRLVAEGNTACKFDPFQPDLSPPARLPTQNHSPRRQNIQKHPGRGRRRIGNRHRHPRTIQHIGRNPRGKRTGRIQPLLV